MLLFQWEFSESFVSMLFIHRFLTILGSIGKLGSG